VEADKAVTRRIVDRERPLNTRTSILNTNNKKHFTDIINAVQRSLKEETTKPKQKPQKSATYDRYNVQEDKNWWKDKLKANDLDDFQIDTRGTFADGNLTLPQPVPATKPPASSSASAGATNDVNNNNNNNNNSANGNKAVVPRKPAPSTSASVPTPIPRPPVKPAGGAPIIIVPSAITSLITMYNIKDFLENGVFVPTIEKKKLAPTKEISMTITKRRTTPGLPTEYTITDSPTTKMTSKDWSRVVAVFVLGQAWQFKDWHWSSPVELLNNVRGFYLKYDDALIPPEVKSWNVKTLSISKSKRHLDQTAALQFWNTLDDFMLRRH